MLWLKPGEVAELVTQQYFALELVTRRQHFLFNSLNFPYFRKKKERINSYILGKDVGHGLYDSSAELEKTGAPANSRWYYGRLCSNRALLLQNP